MAILMEDLINIEQTYFNLSNHFIYYYVFIYLFLLKVSELSGEVTKWLPVGFPSPLRVRTVMKEGVFS